MKEKCWRKTVELNPFYATFYQFWDSIAHMLKKGLLSVVVWCVNTLFERDNSLGDIRFTLGETLLAQKQHTCPELGSS